jgi:predicted XRE-type DNA-binding protein
MKKAEKYDSVWDAIADTPFEAANMRAKAELMRKIVAFINKQNWTQSEAAARAGVTQPRVNDLLRGRVSNFSIDALVNIATSLGLEIHIDVKAA